jgi:hypothetical protein
MVLCHSSLSWVLLLQFLTTALARSSVTWSSHLSLGRPTWTLLYFTLLYFTFYKSPRYTASSTPLLSSSTYFQTSSSAPYSQKTLSSNKLVALIKDVKKCSFSSLATNNPRLRLSPIQSRQLIRAEQWGVASQTYLAYSLSHTPHTSISHVTHQ